MQATSILLIGSLASFSVILLVLYLKKLQESVALRNSYNTLRTFVKNVSFKTSIDLIKYVSESFFSMTGEDIYVLYRNIYMAPEYVQVYKNGKFVGQVREQAIENDLADLQHIVINSSVSIYTEHPQFFKDTMYLLDTLFTAAMNYDELYSKSGIDALTGLHNRAAFEAYKNEVYPFLVQSGSVSFIMFDVDKFKEFNDTFGHDVGDIVLKRVAGAISKSIKKTDFAFRFGGDEMGVIIKGNAKTAKEVAERIRSELRRHSDYKITLSIGIAEAEENEDFAHLQGRADAALYASKDKGRDAVSVAGEKS